MPMFFFSKVGIAKKNLLVLRLQEKDIHTTLYSRKGFVVFNTLVLYLTSKSNITWKHISESLKNHLVITLHSFIDKHYLTMKCALSRKELKMTQLQF